MNLKKFTQKNADGSSVTYEFDVPKMQGIPDHPGEPKGTDTVPAWLTPGEFVVNAEATRMFEPQIEAMNEVGKVVQKAQGGSIPEYKADGGEVEPLTGLTGGPESLIDVPMELLGVDPKDLLAKQEAKRREIIAGPGTPESLASLPLVPERDPKLQEVLDSTNPNLVPTDISGNINYLNSLLPEPSVESRLNQQQRARDLTPDGKSTSVDTDFEYIGTGTPGKFMIQPTTKTKTTKDVATGKTIQEIQNVINDPTATAETEGTSEKDATNAGIEFINNISQNDKFGQTSIDGKEIVRKDGGTPDSDKEEGAGFLSKVSDFFQEHFSDLIDSDKLMNAALLYVGSRALGYSHAGSLNFVGRTYLGEIQKKLKVADQAALSNKYTKESVEKYRDTGKVEDLELRQNIQKLESFDMVDKKTGKTSVITKYEDKNTGKVTHLDSNGKPVKIENFRKLSDDVTISNAQMSKYSNNFEAEIKRQAKDDDELALFSRRLPNPQGFASQIAAKARELGLDENKINSIVPTITRQMIEDVKESDGELDINETLAIPYINAQLVSFSVKDNELKKNLEGASSKVLVTLSEKISNDPIELNAKLKDYSEQYSKLKPREKELFNKKAPDGFTGFTVYVSEQLLNK